MKVNKQRDRPINNIDRSKAERWTKIIEER